MLERTLNARLPPRSTVFLSLPPHPHRRFINYSSPPRTRCHIPLRHVAPLVYRSSNFDNSPPTCLARTNILRRKLDNFSPTTLVTQHFVIQNSLSLSPCPSGLIARNSVGFGDHERHCISMYLNIVIPSWSMERKEVRRGLGYLPRDILLVGNAGFSFLEEVPERGSSEMESSIARRTFQSCDTDYQTSPEEGFQCWKREESLALRVEARAEAGGMTTIGISDSWPMGRVFIWIAISPSSALLSLYDRFIDRSLRIEASCLDRNNEWKLLSSNN